MALKASAINVGDTFSARVVDNLSRTQIVQYAGASGDYNPLHSDEIYTTQIAKYPTVFAHGMLTMGLTGKAVTDLVGDGRLLRYGVRFTKQVWPGDSLDVTTTVDAISEHNGTPCVELKIETKNQDGDVVIQATASARVDP